MADKKKVKGFMSETVVIFIPTELCKLFFLPSIPLVWNL